MKRGIGWYISLFRKIRYPKFLLLIATIIIAYFIFQNHENLMILRYSIPLGPIELLLSMGYVDAFLTGALFAYGFTAAPATAILLILAQKQNIFLTGLVAGAGAVVGDIIIFTFIRYSFADEIKKLSREPIAVYLREHLPHFLRKYLMPVIAGFVIASPLPDEVGVALFAVSTNISRKVFPFVSFVLNSAGIFVILLIGSSI